LEISATVRALKDFYPGAHCALDHETPFQLLIATILSAQCTDERVNRVTPELFKIFPGPQEMALAPVEKLEELVRSTGFFQNKAKNIKGCAQSLVLQYGGQVPQTLDELVELPGVGRKTANVVLGNAFGIISGIVVDTHVSRLASRWKWTKSENAVVIERDLQKKIMHEDWILISHLMIFHGRALCTARSPKCDKCFLFDRCPRAGVK
jgi:endonuclease III